MGLKVAIVGLSPETHHLAPWNDPEWEKWGMPWDGDWARLNRCFEIHDRIDDEAYPKGYRARLKDCSRLYVQRPMAEYPDAEIYPLEDVIQTVGTDYFQSSVAYMIALAIHEGATDIALFGLSMGDDTQYGYQKANAEFLIGVAVGRGIAVHVAGSLCKYQREQAFKQDYPKRYGWVK